MDTVTNVGAIMIDHAGRIGTTMQLGVDETVFVSAGRKRRRQFVSSVTDIEARKVLDVFEGRQRCDLVAWLNIRPPHRVSGVKVVVADLHEPSRRAFDECVPDAVQVADPMHVVMVANRCPDKTRRRVQNEQLAHRGRKDDPLFGARKLLMLSAERLDPRTRKRLDVLLAFGDPNGEVFEAWQAKENVRDLYTLWGEPAIAALWIDSIIGDARTSTVPEIKGLGRTLKQWRTPILAWHTTGASNGPTEGLNSIIKKIKRVAAGFTNFAHYRTRILLAIGGCDWNLIPHHPAKTRRTPLLTCLHFAPSPFADAGVFMNWEVFITCAVTGAGDTVGKSPHVPVTPEQIASSAIDAAKVGAAVVHIHVRDPKTGVGSRDVDLYREVVERIRASDVDVVINLTAGMGGDMVLGGAETPLPLATEGTDMAGAIERLAHVEALLPEICTLDCGTMNFASGGDYIMVNTPAILRSMAKRVQELGVRPELEVFDFGHLVQVKEMVAQGLLDDPLVIQLCMGIAYGAPDDPNTFMAIVNQLPPGAIFSAFSIGRMQIPFVAMAALAGGNVRVGLEDNLYLGAGKLASNADLVGRAVDILHSMNARVMNAEEVRAKLKLRKQTP
jgi:uncharacterized protein (DUF849 family)